MSEALKTEWFLHDLFLLLRESGESAKAGRKSGDAFEMGRHFGIYQALALIKSQAEAFDLNTDEIGIANFDPFRDFLENDGTDK